MTNTIQCTLTGNIESVAQVNYLLSQDGLRFKIKTLPTDEIPTGIHSWQVAPNTSSDGVIGSLYLEAMTETVQEEQWLIAGRVVQLGKRGQFVQLKVSRPGQKTLKISVLGSSKHMKIGELWEVVAKRQRDTLILHRALPQVEHNSNSRPASKKNRSHKPVESRKYKHESTFQQTQTTLLQQALTRLSDDLNPSKSTLAAPPTETIDRVLATLKQKTGVNDWQLDLPKQRGRTRWEWEAFSPSTQQQARVSLKGNYIHVYYYQFPDIPSASVDSQSYDRLIVTPLGAARSIGASCFKILIGPYEVVLDCGTRPKGYDPLPALDYLHNPNLLLISHSHQDHLGAVPVFHSRYPGARMISTHGTREIAHVMLRDGLKIQQLNEDSPELFDEADLEQTLFQLETQPVGKDFEPLPGLMVRFINAGHILGAACIYLRYKDMSLLYTGDFHTTNSRTTNGLNLAELPEADILITESTYGSSVHPARRNQETALMESIAEVVQAGGNVLIPSFALGRAQEILLAIRTSKLFNKLTVPIFVDGLVRAVTEVFRENLDLLPIPVQNLVKINGQEPFFDKTSTPPIISIEHFRERPIAIAKPSVIVASSGMLTGGPSVYYASVLLERENAAIFISGYTDEESPGRLLQSLKTGDTIELDGKPITVKAQIKRFNLSAHTDKVGLGQVINKVKPKHLVLIHGELEALHQVARSGDNQSLFYIHIPAVGDKIELGVAPEQLSRQQLAKIQQPQEFDVMVETFGTDAWLRVPEEVVEKDPRWQTLSISGIIKARWDGVNLKLAPMQPEMILQEEEIEAGLKSGKDCCAVCQFFSGRFCESPDSPLFERRVDPLAICDQFQSKVQDLSTLDTDLLLAEEVDY
ncbi:MAG: MBL fold metallo-hydrolase [Moorea sp. SIO1G6]|nr:MBL fold metallo-hydrolase [Moorena sp. SIO1G6]NET66076.1 MBL fold metallo-hydrolase [Moorena sp. SIO1G6]